SRIMAPSTRSPALALLTCFAVVVASCAQATPDVPPSGPSQTASTGPASMSSAAVSAAASSGNDRLAAEQVLRIDLPEDPETLDPTLAEDPESLDIVRALQRPLVDLDADLDVVPALAASWDVSDDGRTLTFHLRDARYSNGQRIVAGDLVYSWRRLADPRIAS